MAACVYIAWCQHESERESLGEFESITSQSTFKLDQTLECLHQVI